MLWEKIKAIAKNTQGIIDPQIAQKMDEVEKLLDELVNFGERKIGNRKINFATTFSQKKQQIMEAMSATDLQEIVHQLTPTVENFRQLVNSLASNQPNDPELPTAQQILDKMEDLQKLLEEIAREIENATQKVEDIPSVMESSTKLSQWISYIEEISKKLLDWHERLLKPMGQTTDPDEHEAYMRRFLQEFVPWLLKEQENLRKLKEFFSSLTTPTQSPQPLLKDQAISNLVDQILPDPVLTQMLDAINSRIENARFAESLLTDVANISAFQSLLDSLQGKIEEVKPIAAQADEALKTIKPLVMELAAQTPPAAPTERLRAVVQNIPYIGHILRVVFQQQESAAIRGTAQKFLDQIKDTSRKIDELKKPTPREPVQRRIRFISEGMKQEIASIKYPHHFRARRETTTAEGALSTYINAFSEAINNILNFLLSEEKQLLDRILANIHRRLPDGTEKHTITRFFNAASTVAQLAAALARVSRRTPALAISRLQAIVTTTIMQRQLGDFPIFNALRELLEWSYNLLNVLQSPAVMDLVAKNEIRQEDINTATAIINRLMESDIHLVLQIGQRLWEAYQMFTRRGAGGRTTPHHLNKGKQDGLLNPIEPKQTL